jgi:hypothetical protein
MIRGAVVFLLITGFVIAAQEPRAVAEEALGAWRAGDAKRLEVLAHPELKKRFRDARIVRFYVEGKVAKTKILESGSDADVVALFCEALRSIVPRDARVEYFDRFLEARQHGDLAIVSFDSGWHSKSEPSTVQASKIEVILKKVDDEWRFLWSPAAQLHIDLTWDPKE